MQVTETTAAVAAPSICQVTAPLQCRGNINNVEVVLNMYAYSRGRCRYIWRELLYGAYSFPIFEYSKSNSNSNRYEVIFEYIK